MHKNTRGKQLQENTVMPKRQVTHRNTQFNGTLDSAQERAWQQCIG